MCWDAFCIPIPHIYPSVGYCVAYLAQGLSTTFIRITENKLHTFFIYITILEFRWIDLIMKKSILLILLVLLFSPKIFAQKGYENAVQIHFGAYDKAGGGGVEYIGGYRFNEYFFLGGNIGFGLGSFGYDYLCLHSKAYFTKSDVSPFIGLSIGGLSHIKCESLRPVSLLWGLSPIISPSIGVCERTTDKLGVYLSVSCDLTGPFVTSEQPYKGIYFAPHINVGLQF